MYQVLFSCLIKFYLGVRNRSPGQGLTLKEIRKMDYVNKVIDETLRVVSFSLMVFREAKKDASVCGEHYLICCLIIWWQINEI